MRIIVLDHCPGCGKCVQSRVCPTSALVIEKGRAVIGGSCINCGLCIPACPIGLIRSGAEEPEKTANAPDEKPAEVLPEKPGEEEEHEQTSTGS